jgi:dynein heavy chain, axonemal
MDPYQSGLKHLLLQAGVEGRHMVFLFSDNHIVSESFLEDINNMLNSGDVPGMFAQDEKDRIAADLREWAFEHGYPASKEGCYTAFIDRVREKLHIVLAMSPVGDKFRNRCRQFPALINCCTIDYYTQWPEEALLSVSAQVRLLYIDTSPACECVPWPICWHIQHAPLLNKIPEHCIMMHSCVLINLGACLQLLRNVELGSDAVKSAVSEVCMYMHISVTQTAVDFFNELRRKYYTTPKSFLDLINLYCTLLAERRTEMGETQERLLVGLQKLHQTNSVVDKMKAELGVPILSSCDMPEHTPISVYSGLPCLCYRVVTGLALRLWYVSVTRGYL